MLSESPSTLNDVPVMPLCWRVTVENPGSVATCRAYESAPAEEFHVSVGLVGIPVEPLAGELRTGIVGTVPPDPPKHL